jgi:hypothetical protein
MEIGCSIVVANCFSTIGIVFLLGAEDAPFALCGEGTQMSLAAENLFF